MMDIQQKLQQVTQVLHNTLGYTVALVDPVLIKAETRCAVVRCRVLAAQSEITSVVIKLINKAPALGFSEWASLAFCADVPDAQHLVPGFLGGDVVGRFFVMEDLGESRTLADILAQENSSIALSALTKLATTMAQLHVATLGRADHFEHHRMVLPYAKGLGRHAEAEAWLAKSAEIVVWLDAVGYVTPSGFTACLERIAEVYRTPGPFLSLSHGDPAPTNNHFGADGHVRLLDFEYGGFRHALYDISAWNTLCPLPNKCVQQMNNTFRTILAQAIPAAHDDTQYAQAWAYLCAYRVLAMLTWIKPTVLEENQPWVDEHWTGRHAVLAAVIRLHEATVGIPSLEPVHQAAAGLRTALVKRWPEYTQTDEVIPQWKAFAG